MLAQQSPPQAMEAFDQARRLRRKRKADTQDNERLSKRLSLLNLGTDPRLASRVRLSWADLHFRAGRHQALRARGEPRQQLVAYATTDLDKRRSHARRARCRRR